MHQHIGVSMSGGGHRATMWGLGTLLYLVDAGKHREVAAISSVSGGSIANGVVAHEVDYPSVDAKAFDERMAPLVRHVANTGLFFWGPSTNAYVVSLLALTGLAVLTLTAGLVLLALDGLDLRSGLVLLAGAVLLALAARWFERRSSVVDRALAREHFTTDRQPTPLAEVKRSLDHVMCATELQSGDHLYMAPHFLYSYQLGAGEPAQLRLSTAVQASACLPGAFAVRRLPTAPYAFAGGASGPRDAMVLTDGGVYDNMADQWIAGLSARLQRIPHLPVAGPDIDEAIVVNASSPTAWTRMRRLRLVVLAELATLQRVNSVMYQVTTERRRQSLVASWDGDATSPAGARGALVHIAQSPYHVAERYRASTRWPDRAERAKAVITTLGGDDASREQWASLADRSRAVPTVLRRLGRDATLDLLEHSYVLAMCNLHVLLGHPLLPLPGRERFARLLD